MTEQKRSLSPLSIVLILSGSFFLIFLFISGILFLGKSPRDSSGNLTASTFFSNNLVGVIEVDGVILDSKKTLAKLDRYEEDDQIKAVVLRLNSPGGAVAPSQEIYEAVKKYKKPLVVSMSSVAASGAYYIACGAKKVFANPGTITGSIGVVMEFANLEKLYDWAKIHRYSIKTGKFKDAGAEYRPMTADERALFQAMVDDVLTQFKKAVSVGRHLTMEQVTAIADGRIFSGSQALAAHLVDELGTLRDAIQEAANEAQIKGKPKVIFYEKQRRKIWDLLFEDNGPDSSSFSPVGGPIGGLLEQFGSLIRTGTLGRSAGVSPFAEIVPGIYWIWGGMR